MESTLPAARVEDPLPHPHPVPPGTGMSPSATRVPARGDTHGTPHRPDVSRLDAVSNSPPSCSGGHDADGSRPHSDTARSDVVLNSIPSEHTATTPDSRQRRGKAPPTEFFSGEDPVILLDDWLPSLE